MGGPPAASNLYEGGSKGKLTELSKELFEQELKHERAGTIKSALTMLDPPKPRKKDSSDWKLAQKTFRKLMTLWGPPNIDPFAARHNSQLQHYYGFKPDLQALAMDVPTAPLWP